MSSAPFWLRDSGGCAATDPVVDVARVKAAASDAEARVVEQPAQVGAADRLLVAADELGDVERRQQAVRQFAQRGRRRVLVVDLRDRDLRSTRSRDGASYGPPSIDQDQRLMRVGERYRRP